VAPGAVSAPGATRFMDSGYAAAGGGEMYWVGQRVDRAFDLCPSGWIAHSTA
jgi:hypothetical protein